MIDASTTPPAPQPAWRVGILAAAGAVGTSSVVPALPVIADALVLNDAATAAVVSAYVVPYATSTIIAGQLCDDRGPRTVLRIALVLAVVGAAMAATAAQPWVLLTGRAVQGVGGGAATMAAYDVARRAPGGIASTAALLTLGASVGPLLGGLLTRGIGWQAAVALPGVLHVTGLFGLRVPADGGGQRGVDARGLTATAIGATTGAAGLQVAQTAPAPAVVLGVVAVVTLGWAGRRSVIGAGRVPPRQVLVSPDLRRRGALAASIAGTYFASLVLIPVALGRAGFDAVAIGALLVPGAVSGAVSARASERTGAVLGRWTDAAGALVTVVVLATVLLAPPVVAALALVGLAAAYGTVQPRLLAAVAEHVSQGPATAIGTANLLLLLGGGVGSAAVGGLGRSLGGTVLLVLVVVVAGATVRASAVRRPLGGRT